jgi:hypothetical protein
MAKRRIEDAAELEEKKPNPLVADASTNVIYTLNVMCIRCARLTVTTLHSNDLPAWAVEFLKTVRYDSPSEPCSEKSRTKEWLKNKVACKHSLELQALCEPSNWSETKKNKCVREGILDSLKRKYPDANIEPGLFWKLNRQFCDQSLTKVVSGYDELLTSEIRFVPNNSILLNATVTIMEHWRDDIK